MLALVNPAGFTKGSKIAESDKNMKNRPSRKAAPASKRPARDIKSGSFGKKGKPNSRARSESASAPAKTERPQTKGKGKSSYSKKPETSAKPQSLPLARPRLDVRPSRDEKKGERKPLSASPRREQVLPKVRGQLLWGVHAVREAWLNPKRRCLALWATESGLAALRETMEEGRGLPRPSPTKLDRAEIDRFLPRGSVHQGLALEVEPLNEMAIDDLLGLEEAATLVVVLDQVTDPHNVGAIMRSAAAFGADAVIVTERNAPGTTGILAKSACGAAEHVPLIPVVNLARALEALKAESFWCIGLAEEGAKDLAESALGSGRVALVMGAEGDGLRRLTREHCDELARLPTSGPIGSLNVSNAAAISLYEVKRQRG